ncbi:MAG: SDR family NAD(P)-dependent oxidoreductase, partial [Gemmatimonadetes bacterium]|nr:SDR family NAD(P)-dependent oxidoreductase [Gemmatimonadota bacterium]
MSRPVCLVSGSSSGIGTAIVAAFAANGYDVVVHYNSGSDPSDPRAHKSSGEERAAAVANKLRTEHGVEALSLGADLSQPEAPFDLVDRAYAPFGRPETVVSNNCAASR